MALALCGVLARSQVATAEPTPSPAQRYAVPEPSLVRDLLLTEARGIVEGPESAAQANPVQQPWTRDGSQPFRDAIASHVPVKRLVFRYSRNHITDLTNPRKPTYPPGFDEFEGAVQPSGYYLLKLPHSSARVDNHNPVGETLASGASSCFWWQLNDNYDSLRVATRNNAKWPMDPVAVVCTMDFDKLAEVAHCGMLHIADADIRWLDPRRFRAESQRFGILEGQIASFDDTGRPTRLWYHSPTNSVIGSFDICYSYKDATLFPPSTMIVRRTGPGQNRPPYTNIILSYDPGLQMEATNGFVPSQFRRKSQPLATFIVYSNSVRYKVLPNGQWYPAPESEWETPGLAPRSATMAASSFTFALAVLGFAATALATWQRAKQPRPVEKERHRI